MKRLILYQFNIFEIFYYPLCQLQSQIIYIKIHAYVEWRIFNPCALLQSYRNPRTHHCAGWLYFRTRSQHHPQPTVGSSFSLSLDTYELHATSLFTDRVLCTRSHRITGTHAPLPYPDFIVIETRFSRHFDPSPFVPRARRPSTYTLFRRHGGTLAVLGTRAV